MEPAVDGRKAETDAKGLIAEIYQTIGYGKTDSLFSLISDPVVVFGPRRTDAMLTRSDALVALGKVIDPKAKKHAQPRSEGPWVVTSEGGHSAWAFDIVHVDSQVLVATAVLSNTDDLWSVTATALAETPAGKQVKAESARDAVVPPGAATAGKIDLRAEPAIAKFKQGLVDQQAWGDDLSSRSDAIVVGPTVGEVARGKTAVRQKWKARMTANVREATSGEITAAMTPDGQLVWISVPVTRVADDEAPLPLRVFAVYEKDGAGWKMIALHEAVALDEPGSGTAFKKILPPAPAPPEPPKAEPEDKKPEDKKLDNKKPEAKVTAKKKPKAKKQPPKKRRPPVDD